jgi:hypothetical protein
MVNLPFTIISDSGESPAGFQDASERAALGSLTIPDSVVLEGGRATADG